MLSVVFVASGTWVCPNGITKIIVQCVGSGASGGAGLYENGAGGGGGGAYAKTTMVPTAGRTYVVTISADAKFSYGATTYCLADGGYVGQNSTEEGVGAGGSGGTVGNCVGDVKTAGNDGASGFVFHGGKGGNSALGDIGAAGGTTGNDGEDVVVEDSHGAGGGGGGAASGGGTSGGDGSVGMVMITMFRKNLVTNVIKTD